MKGAIKMIEPIGEFKKILGALVSSVLLMDMKEVGVNKREYSNKTAAILCALETFMQT